MKNKLNLFISVFSEYAEKLAPEIYVRFEKNNKIKEAAAVIIYEYNSHAVLEYNSEILKTKTEKVIIEIAKEEALHLCFFPLSYRLEDFYNQKLVHTIEHQIIWKLLKVIK